METLWAPWRMVYVDKEWSSNCILCDIPSSQDDEKYLLLHRGKSVFSLLNLYPYNPGHIMIAPYRHLNDLHKLSDDEQYELIHEAARSTSLLRKTLNPDGYNLGMNLGKAAGAGVEDHLHLHIVPRWSGDTNFMPVVGHTKVIPEALAATYRKLAVAFRNTASEGGDDAY